MRGRAESRPMPAGEQRPAEAGIRLIARNGMLSAAQMVLTSLGYLLAYRVMSSTVGIEVIGSWSLCLALGSVATLADLGASDGMARTVAQGAVGSCPSRLRGILVTGLLFGAAACLTGGLLCYAMARALLPMVLSDPTALATTLTVLAPAIAVACLNALGLSCQGVLEGLERYQLRFVAGVAGTLVFVAAIMALAPAAGLRGVVLAYAAQAAVLLAISGTLCWRLTRPSESVAVGTAASSGVLRELVRIGLPVRATGLMTVLLDPLTRIGVTYFGGAASAGHYEVASRLALQLRNVIVSAFQAGLPRLVRLATLDSQTTAGVTAQTYRAGLSIAVAAFTMAVLLAPFIYRFVLGHVSAVDMRFFLMLCAGWCVNAVSAPFFFSLVAKRRITALWLSSGMMAVVNLGLFGLLGWLLGVEGVVASLAIAVAAGSAVTIVAALRMDIVVPQWIQVPELLLLAASFVAVAVFVGPILQMGDVSGATVPLIGATLVYGVAFLATLHYSRIFYR